MSLRNEQCRKVCRILDDVLANRPTERDALIVAVRTAFDELEERKTGKWIERESGTEDKENGFETVIVCSRCDFPATTFYSEDCESRTQIRTDFCPNCGAKMEGTS